MARDQPADRLLHPLRQRERKRGIGTTKARRLLKHQIPIRTFANWDDVQPGFFEDDLVAHCGTSAVGAFLQTLTLTDVATGWTECLPLICRAQHPVVAALDRTDVLLPFPIRGLDTGNGSKLLNAELLTSCEECAITSTRGRVARKNDQCYVEQKTNRRPQSVLYFPSTDRHPPGPNIIAVSDLSLEQEWLHHRPYRPVLWKPGEGRRSVASMQDETNRENALRLVARPDIAPMICIGARAIGLVLSDQEQTILGRLIR